MQIKPLIMILLSGAILSGCALTSSYGPQSRLTPVIEERIGRLEAKDRPTPSPDGEPVTHTPREQALVSDRRRAPGERPRIIDASNSSPMDLSGPAINATLPAQPLSSFVDTVLGEILGIPYALGPGVADRQDIVSLRSVRDMEPETFYGLFEAAIAEYGLAINTQNNMALVVERSDLRNSMPQIIQARARGNVSAALRPVIQFIEFDHVDVTEISLILQEAFPRQDELSFRARNDINSMIIIGLSDMVNSAAAIAIQLDHPRFAGAAVVTLSPRNWEAEELADALDDILSLEGYQIGRGTNQPHPLTLLELGQTNQILVFAHNETSLNHLIATARELEQAAEREDATRSYVYQVRNTDATELASIVRTVLGETGLSNTGPATEAGGPNSLKTRLAVDMFGNRLIFTGSRTEYDNLVRLLEQLDTPVAEVLVEVTIAEAVFTDSTRYGIEFFLNTLDGDIQIGTQNGLGLQSGGLSTVINAGQLDLEAAARASNTRIDVLSTPRIVARSGESAEVQVGSDVPIITSQRAASTQVSGSTDILQTVSYRSTGVLLTVEPRVFSNNRIDLNC